MSLNGKKILLGVTGGIAAYKACTLTSSLTKAGADVHVMMSKGATRFVTPQTFQALSRNPVHDDVFTEKNENQIAHIDLADQADLVVIAPITANTIAKLAQGFADDMVTTVALATKAPIWVAPAMNVNMFHHPAVKKNLATLREYGYKVLASGTGPLACGWVGEGRLMEPEEIFWQIQAYFNNSVSKDLEGKQVLVTAGPTQEPLDPVRFLTNHSTGKMGYALAKAAKDRGANVTLVSGPTVLTPPLGVKLIKVESALEMYHAVMGHYDDSNVVIKTAAVSDYRAKEIKPQKIKKTDGNLIIELERNPDILAELGRRKTKQILIGFAAETDHLEAYAQAKLEKKNLDMVVANDVSKKDIGFGSNDNQVTLYFREKPARVLDKLPKENIAEIICDEVRLLMEKSRSV